MACHKFKSSLASAFNLEEKLKTASTIFSMNICNTEYGP